MNIEKNLFNLPKARLSKRADFLIKLRIFHILGQQRLAFALAGLTIRQLYPVPVVLLLIIAVIAIPSYAYTSPSVTSASLLYPIKKTIEELEVGLADTPAKEAAVYEKLASRRLAEAEKISQEVVAKRAASETAGVVLRETITEAERLSDQAESAMDKITDEPAQKKTETKAGQTQSKQTDALSRIAQTVGISADEKIIDTVALALDRFQGKRNRKEKETLFKNSQDRPKLPENATTTGDIIGTSTDNAEPETAVNTKEKNNGETSTTTQRTDKREKRNEQPKKQATESLQEIIDKAAHLKEDLSVSGFDQEDVTNLFGQIDRKIEKAQEKIKSDDLKDINGILKSADALTNNAKHFIKQQDKTNKSDKKSKQKNKEKKLQILKTENNDEATSSEEKINKFKTGGFFNGGNKDAD